MADYDDLRRLLTNPRETLDLELKEWVDPQKPEGRAKIARGCLAMRNNDGGRLVIGFTDAGRPATENVPPNVRDVFHNDVVQSIVSSYAADPFTVDVEFVELSGQEYPVISVPSGVRTPVAAKADLKDPNDSSGRKFLVRDHVIYVRSVNSNNVVSSTDARKGDWGRLTTLCFNNREADIGGFVRRHLAALDLNALAAMVPAFAGILHRPSTRERAMEELNRGRGRFEAAAQRREMRPPAIGFRESAIIVEGEFPPQATTVSFRDKLLRSAPSHTGWPPWVNLWGATDELWRPRVFENGWESLVQDLNPATAFLAPHLDFWRMEPRGVFHHIRALEDDLATSRGLQPLTALDFLLQISRTAEVISTGLSFGQTLGCDATKTSLIFGFRWTRLRGRALVSWVEPSRWFRTTGVAEQDEFVASVVVPLDTPPSGIAPHVGNIVQELFALFGGREVEPRVVEEIVAETVERRL